MRKYLIFLLLPLVLHSCGTASRMGRADRPWSYEVENAGVGADGVYALRVWSYYRTPDMPVTTAEKNAVHAVIFKGVPAGNGATAQPPLKTDGVTPSDSLFFENFFQNDYRAYVSSVASGSRQVMKTGKKEYKIGYFISVSKDRLRGYLEEKGVVKSLSSGF